MGGTLGVDRRAVTMDDTDENVQDDERAREDALIRAYLLAQAQEWAEYERVYGCQREWKAKAA
jgi:hypothetical protein